MVLRPLYRNNVATHCACVTRFPSVPLWIVGVFAAWQGPFFYMHQLRALVFIPSFSVYFFVVRIWLSQLFTSLLQLVYVRVDIVARRVRLGPWPLAF